MEAHARQPAIDDRDVEPAIALRERLWRSLLAATVRAAGDALTTAAARLAGSPRASAEPRP